MGEILLQAGGFCIENPAIQPVSEVTDVVTSAWLGSDDESHSDHVVSDSHRIDQHSQIIKNNLSIVQEEDACEDGQRLNDYESNNDRNICRTPTQISLPLRQQKRDTWTTPERKLMREHFKSYLLDDQIPSLRECQMLNKSHHLLRTSSQIQCWIRAEIKRQRRPFTKGWTTPQKIKCRKYFRHYYEGRKSSKYPTAAELLVAIKTVPEFEGKSPDILRGHLQHDYKYVSSRLFLD